MEEEIVQTVHITKIYENKTYALRDFSIKLKKGEWTSIMGPSGSGKTTLLNLISCLDKPSKGSIVVNGVEVTQLDQSQLTCFRRKTVGLIFQQYHLIPYLTALENVMIAQYYHSTVKEEAAQEALEIVGLGHRLNHIPSHLSGGEQQRVCIARALINDPEILIADEPTGNLDQNNGQIVLDLIKGLQNEGHTIILVTHNPKIAKMGERVVELLDGEVLKDYSN